MSKVLQFFKDVKSELFKVIWPSRSETIRYTITVILFSVSIALILGAIDLGLLRGFEAILNK
jgi:preprotein translocase subunit SecE